MLWRFGMIWLDKIEDIYNQGRFTLHEMVLNEIGSFVFVKNRKGEYLYANQLTLKLFNLTLTELQGKTDHDLFHGEHLADILHSDKTVFETKKTFINQEHTKAQHDDKLVIYRAIKNPILENGTGDVLGIIGVSTDITDLVEMQEKLQFQAHTDELTSLFNRRKLWAIFHNYFEEAVHNHFPLSCISIDIDNFKQVNDTYGHCNGDEVICHLARLTEKHIRSNDASGRVGGEEFIIILHNTPVTDAIYVAERIRKGFSEHDFFNDNATFSISCGITQIDRDDADFFDLYRRSDKALYKAKIQGKNRSDTILKNSQSVYEQKTDNRLY